jgi:ceramide glucosyltransferase
MSCFAVLRRRRPTLAPAADSPAVTLLKPLHGVDAETYECLRSFCDQAYPEFQIVFGVAEPKDRSIAVVRRLQKEYPHRDLRLVIDRRQHGSNRKVSNLINMMRHAAHDYLILSDSDVRVSPGYIAELMEPLRDPAVGIVTCAYRGRSRRGTWSLMGSMFINDWFMPSVRVAAMIGSRSFAFGATIGIRRDVLARIGGFPAIANQLADDYRLGELTRRLGLRTVLAELQVDIAVEEASFRQLVEHELRWLRTIRSLRPLSYVFSFIMFGFPVAAFGALLARGGPAVLGMLMVTGVSRCCLHLRTRERRATLRQALLVPVRDCLSLWIWAWGFVTRRVRWKDDVYRIGRDGTVLQT